MAPAVAGLRGLQLLRSRQKRQSHHHARRMTVPQFLEQHHHHLRSICREQSRSVLRQIVHFAVAAMQISAAAAQSVVRLTTRGVFPPAVAIQNAPCIQDTVSCRDGSPSAVATVLVIKCAISAMCDRAVHSGRKNNDLVCAKHGPPLCVMKHYSHTKVRVVVLAIEHTLWP